ncbi:MAG: 2-oxo acid dehydrogenase subunit E2 [bacterium]|nr:2-oxo acid dehydrogenase subunit E2 [bacterium]
MAFVFKFPDVGEGIHEGRVVEWLVVEGQTVAEDEPLLKVETDKAVVELPSPKAGVVLRLHVAADATIEVGDALIAIGEAGEDLPDDVADADMAQSVDGEAVAAAVAAVQEPEDEDASRPPRRPLATPRTRALARRLGIDLATVDGSGSGGRITDEDVEREALALQENKVACAEPASLMSPRASSGDVEEAPEAVEVVHPFHGTVETGPDGDVERVPITHLRKRIAEAMRASKQMAAHVTHVDEADVTDLLAHHRAGKAMIEERHGVRFTLLPFFIKALITALKDHPIFNAMVDEERDEIILKRFYNIGIAVDAPEGLIVPVLKNADQKDMITIAREVADLAERARSRQLALPELRGSTCTITNLGPLGGVFATPILNPPELAILGLHAIKERPAVVNGEIAIRDQMYLSVSFDHRYIDGADAARFMSDIVRMVSNPNLLTVRL